MRGTLALFSLILLVCPASAQEPPDGLFDKVFEKKMLKLRKKVTGITDPFKSSALWQKKYNWGFPRKLKDRANTPEQKEWMAARIEERKTWVEGRRAILEKANIRHACVVETDNFIIFWTIPRWTVGPLRLNLNHAAHLFAKRMDDVAKRFKEITGSLPPRRQTLYLMANRRDNRLVTAHLMGVEQDNGFTRYGQSGQWCSWPDPARPRLLKDDERFHAHVLHGGTNLLTRAAHRLQVTFTAWFQVGMSHLLEHEKFGLVRNFDFKEIQAKSNWDSSWKKKIFREVGSRKEPSFAKVISMDVDQMNYHENAYAWSYLDFLFTAHKEKFPEFFRRMKETNDTKKSLEDVFGWSTAGFQEKWRAYVLNAYGMR